MAATRDLNFVAIETTPETLADASTEFNRVVADRLTRPAYVFADDSMRAGAVWYLHFRIAEAGDRDAARWRATGWRTSRWSTPASIARTTSSSMGYRSATAFIPRSSDTSTPRKPKRG